MYKQVHTNPHKLKFIFLLLSADSDPEKGLVPASDEDGDSVVDPPHNPPTDEPSLSDFPDVEFSPGRCCD